MARLSRQKNLLPSLQSLREERLRTQPPNDWASPKRRIDSQGGRRLKYL